MCSAEISLERLTPHSPELGLCARWRHEAFLKDDGYSVDDSLRQLITLTASDAPDEMAVLARVGGVPAGVCLLVRHELDAAHHLTPWLASLYVAADFRRKGVARALVGAMEAHAEANGIATLYLYTVDAEAFYLKCGWSLSERFSWHGTELVLMQRDIGRL